MSIIETMIDIPMEHERNVCGQFDAYLKKIERTLHVTMITETVRGSDPQEDDCIWHRSGGYRKNVSGDVDGDTGI